MVACKECNHYFHLRFGEFNDINEGCLPTATKEFDPIEGVYKTVQVRANPYQLNKEGNCPSFSQRAETKNPGSCLCKAFGPVLRLIFSDY